MKDKTRRAPHSTSEDSSSWARGRASPPASGPGPSRPPCAPLCLLSTPLQKAGGAGRVHPATASWHPMPLQFLTKGATRTCCGSFWSSVRLRVGVCVRGSVCALGAGPRALPAAPLRFLRTGSLKAWPFPFPGLAWSRLCSLLCSRPASPPCPGCWGTEPPGASLWGGQPSQLGLHCRPGVVGTVGKRGSPTVSLPFLQVLAEEGGGLEAPWGVSGFSHPLSAASDAEAFSRPSLLGAVGGLGCPRQLLLPSAARELRHLCQWQRPKPQL